MSTAVSRLIWKEYRAQRTLWVVLVFFTVVLQGSYFLFDATSRPLMRPYPATIAFALAICQAMACASVLFAAEREQHTDRLLGTFPLSARELFLAKLGFAVLSVGLFISAVSLWTQLIYPGSYVVWGGDPIQMNGATIWQSLAIVWGMFGLTLLTAMFTTSVITSVMLAAGAFFVICAPPTFLLRNVVAQETALAIASAIAGTIGVAISLFRGPTWLRRYTHETGEVFNSGKQPVLVHSSLRQSFLRMAATQSSDLARSTGVLLWMEVLNLLPLAVLLTLCGVSFISGRMLISANDFDSQGTGFFTIAVALPVIAWLLGLKSFSSGQTSRPVSFLCDRGLPPFQVWVCKQVVALPIALVSAAIVLQVMNAYALDPLIQRDIVLIAGPQQLHIYSLFFVTLAASQLFSQWMRSSILKFLVSGFSVFLIVMFTGTIVLRYRVSILPALICPAVLFLLCGLQSMPAWLRGANAWHFTGRNLICLAASVLFATVCIERDRIVSVPPAPEPIDWRGMAYSLQWADHSVTSKLQTFLQPIPVQTGPDGLSTADGRDDQNKLRIERLHTLAQSMPRKKSPVIDATALASLGNLDFIGPLSDVRSEASSLRYRGELAAVSEILRDELVVIDGLLPQVWRKDVAMKLVDERDIVLESIRRWSQHPAQQTDLLVQAAEAVSADHSDMLTRMQRMRYLRVMEALHHVGVGESERKKMEEFRGTWTFFPYSLQNRIEDARAERVLNAHFQQLSDATTMSRFGDVSPVHTNLGWTKGTPEWWFTPALWLYDDILSLDDSLVAKSLTSSLGTWLVLELEIWKREHGEYPRSLQSLISERMPQVPIDPRTSAPFHYEPEGITLPLVHHAMGVGVLHPGTPILWTSSSPHPHIQNYRAGEYEYAALTPLPRDGALTIGTVESMLQHHAFKVVSPPKKSIVLIVH